MQRLCTHGHINLVLGDSPSVSNITYKEQYIEKLSNFSGQSRQNMLGEPESSVCVLLWKYYAEVVYLCLPWLWYQVMCLAGRRSVRRSDTGDTSPWTRRHILQQLAGLSRSLTERFCVRLGLWTVGIRSRWIVGVVLENNWCCISLWARRTPPSRHTHPSLVKVRCLSLPWHSHEPESSALKLCLLLSSKACYCYYEFTLPCLSRCFWCALCHYRTLCGNVDLETYKLTGITDHVPLCILAYSCCRCCTGRDAG